MEIKIFSIGEIIEILDDILNPLSQDITPRLHIMHVKYIIP